MADVVDVESGDSFTGIQQHFLSEAPKTIDLRDINEEDNMDNPDPLNSTSALAPGMSSNEKAAVSEESSMLEETEADLRLVKFRYDGTPQLSFTADGDEAGSCTAVEYLGSDEATYGCHSLHVIKSKDIFEATLRLSYQLTPAVSCDIVDDSVSALMTNNLGVTEYDREFWGDYIFFCH